MFVPSHAEPTDDIKPLVDVNIKKVEEIAEKIIEICTEPLCFEHILQKLFEMYNLKMTFEQYVVVESSLNAYLHQKITTPAANCHRGLFHSFGYNVSLSSCV